LPDHQPNPEVVAQLVFEMGMERTDSAAKRIETSMFATNLSFSRANRI